jgi:hypothetical protein
VWPLTIHCSKNIEFVFSYLWSTSLLHSESSERGNIPSKLLSSSSSLMSESDDSRMITSSWAMLSTNVHFVSISPPLIVRVYIRATTHL